MKNRTLSQNIFTVSKILMCVFLVVISSCEDLDEALSGRDKICDTWKCSENQSNPFLVEIEADATNINGVKIYNFNLLGNDIYVNATVSGMSISIPQQTQDGFKISGSGTIKSGYEEISLNYTVNDGGGSDIFTAKLTKP
jgi:hypothetical protein